MFSHTRFFVTVLAWAYFFVAEIEAVNGTSNSTGKVPLRIMALGASVTFGIRSTTGDSYRKDLRDLLVGDGNEVSFVGSNRNGNFSDNAVQAVPGFVIEQIAVSAGKNVPKFKPNLVLLDAGTNNCNQGGTVPDAGTNVTNMINNIFTQSPGATVILTTILVNSVAEQDSCRVTVNSQYTALASSLQATGAKLVLVDMRGSGGPLVTDLADGRHPNDAGYAKMANIWFGGIQEVISKGLLTTPTSVNSTSTSTTAYPSSSNPTSSTRSETPTAVASNKPAVLTNAGVRIAEDAEFKMLFIPLFVAAIWS